jgi:hypothetical protein
MSKQLERMDNMGKFEKAELQDLSALQGGAATSTTGKKTLESKNDKDSSAESQDSLAFAH